jgi:hypothetical protein
MPNPVKRVAALTSVMALLIVVLIAVVALPASAATRTRTPNHTATDLLFGGLSIAAIVLVAGAVLWYTARTRRSL